MAQNKWPGYHGGEVTVADELAFDALPIETQQLAERVIGLRDYERGARGYDVAYEDGHQRGREQGKEDAETEAKEKAERDNEERIEGLTRDIDRLTAANDALAELTSTLESKLNNAREQLRRARAS